jgi:glucokinase
MKIVAAIDIGGTNSSFGLVNKQGEIIARSNIETNTIPEPEQLVQVISEELTKLINDYSTSLNKHLVLIGIGIGAPNGNVFNGCIEFAPNLKWKGVIPLANMFENKLNVKVVLTNDANAATLGEMIFGGAKSMKDFMFITLGTGLGSGIVANGDMIYGHDGLAGEVGHVIVIPNGRQCGCGRQGCLETYCSATGLVSTYKEMTKQQEITITAKQIYNIAIEGDSAANKAFAYTAEILGLGLANSAAYTSPEAIFLFGGLAQAGELLFAPTKISFEKNILNIYKDKIKLLPSELSENDAALLGAASLIWKLE